MLPREKEASLSVLFGAGKAVASVVKAELYVTRPVKADGCHAVATHQFTGQRNTKRSVTRTKRSVVRLLMVGTSCVERFGQPEMSRCSGLSLEQHAVCGLERLAISFLFSSLWGILCEYWPGRVCTQMRKKVLDNCSKPGYKAVDEAASILHQLLVRATL